MKLSFAILTAIGVAALAQTASAADITGTITLKGTPGPEAKMDGLKNDAACGKGLTEVPTTHHWIVGANGELANVVVMLKGAGLAKAADASTPPAVLDQKGCLYVPQIMAIQVGQKLLVKNSDPATVPMHNVHITPTAGPNAEAFATKISQPQMSGGADLTYDFPAAENFMKFQCDVHPWMFAWVTVVDNPYFAVTDKEGKFTIKNVPAGKYKIVAMHRKAAPTGVEKDVDTTGGNATADFVLEVK
jgi:hypothetical protein